MTDKSDQILIAQHSPFELPKELKHQLSAVKLLALDVDGILTDGSVTYDSNGTEHKSFNIKDGLGIKLAQKAGIKVAIITGRVSPMVERRSNELGIDFVIQGREDKGTALKELTRKAMVELEHIAYAGDDLPDYQAIRIAGVGITVSDGHPEVKKIADWVTPAEGGKGAVRQICDGLLLSIEKYDEVLSKFKLI